MDQLKNTRYLATLHTTMTRIKDPVLRLNSAGDKEQCANRAKNIQAKPNWSTSDAVRFAFYAVEAAKDKTETDAVIEQAAAVLNACLAKHRGLQNDQLFTLFGVRPGTTEAELLQARSFAANLLKDSQDREAQLELDIEQLKQTIATQTEQIGLLADEKQTLVSQRDEAVKRQEELSAELQTALIPKAPTVVTDSAETQKLTQQLADAMKIIESQNSRLLKYAAAPKFDEEVTQVMDFLVRKLPSEDIEVKLALYFRNASILGKG